MIDAALALFEENGFEAVTVDQIAAATSVSPRTFFRYFESKEAVLFAEAEEMFDVLDSTINAASVDEPPLHVLREAVTALALHTADHRERQLRRVRLAQTGAAVLNYQRTVLQPRCEDVLVAAVAAHLGVEVDADLRPRLFAGIGVAVLSAVSAAWMASDGRLDVTGLVEQAFDQLETEFAS